MLAQLATGMWRTMIQRAFDLRSGSQDVEPTLHRRSRGRARRLRHSGVPGWAGTVPLGREFLTGSSDVQLPSVSVIIPCRDAIDSLEAAILAICEQSSVPEEVICVDDGFEVTCLRETEKLTRAFKVRFIRLPKATHPFGRRSMARNAGTRLARGNVVLYIDQDMILAPHYVAAIRRIHAADHLALVKGARYSIPVCEQHRGTWHVLWVASEPERYPVVNESLYSGASRSQTGRDKPGKHDLQNMLRYSARWDYCASNNLSVRRCHIVSVGFWDESFIGWGEEDIDFAYRLFQGGCRPVLPVNGPVYAYHVDHTIDLLANHDSLRRNARHFVRKYPEMAEYRREAYRFNRIVIPTAKDELREFLRSTTCANW